MTRRRAHGPISLAICLFVGALGGCGNGGGSAQDGVRPYGVGVRTETFVDMSRPTDAKGGEPAKVSRTLVTSIYYPTPSSEGPEAKEAAPAATREGGFPMVVFGPGNGSSPGFYAVLLKACRL